ncbi:hypothetical protein HK102_004614 [Quaeritorhiza haematococci]|nr:hypothetical protein HK102_004614 [Quaeritorhiza haematococci]
MASPVVSVMPPMIPTVFSDNILMKNHHQHHLGKGGWAFISQHLEQIREMERSASSLSVSSSDDEDMRFSTAGRSTDTPINEEDNGASLGFTYESLRRQLKQQQQQQNGRRGSKASTSTNVKRTSLYLACATNRWAALCGPVSWPDLWEHVASSSRTPFEQQLFWKILHRRLPVNHYLKDKAGVDRSCPRCSPKDSETIEHVLFQCRLAKAFWNRFHELLQSLLEHHNVPTITLRDVVYFFPDLRPSMNEDELHVMNVLHSVALWSLWGARSCSSDSDQLVWTFFRSRLQARVFLEYTSSSMSNDNSTSEIGFKNRWCGNGSQLVNVGKDGALYFP